MSEPLPGLESSRCVAWIRAERDRLAGIAHSARRRLAKRLWLDELIDAWREAPLHFGGTTILAAVVTDLVCRRLTDQTITLAGMGLRIVLAVASAFAMMCPGEWAIARQGSWVARGLSDPPESKDSLRGIQGQRHGPDGSDG